jgi:uncharacterized protein (TIGR01777 family)
LSGAKAVVNLAGRSVNCRPTPGNRTEIVQSRVRSVMAVDEAIRQAKRAPEVVVQCSAVGFYGNTEAACDESAGAGTGFLADACAYWEEAFRSLSFPETRKVLLRIGIVLGADGGALPVLRRITKRFMGGTAGSGRQCVSWIHAEDMNAVFTRAIEQPGMEGIYNAVSPHPETNAVLMRTLRSVMRRPWCPPAPGFAVRVGAFLMGTNAELVLTGQRVVPRRLLDAGFAFAYPNLEDALTSLIA